MAWRARPLLLFRQTARLGVHHAQGADHKTVGRGQRGAAVHAHERRVDRHRHAGGAEVLAQVGDLGERFAHHRQRTIAIAARQRIEFQASPGFDPDPLGVDQ
jgi:hypothetical protein